MVIFVGIKFMFIEIAIATHIVENNSEIKHNNCSSTKYTIICIRACQNVKSNLIFDRYTVAINFNVDIDTLGINSRLDL